MNKFLHKVYLMIKRFLTFCMHMIKYHFLICFVLVLICLCINEISLFGINPFFWDYMYVTGVIMFAISIRLGLNSPKKMEEMLTRLVNRGSLQLTPDKLMEFVKEINTTANRWAHWVGLISGLVLLIVILIVMLTGHIVPPEAIIPGYVLGRFLGRMIAYGRLWRVIKNHNIPLKVQSGHLDKVAGFEPIGKLYFFQAMVVTVPALYLAVWWFLIPVFGQRYLIWRMPFLGILGGLLIVELLAFLLPILSFHREMQEQKARLQQEADELSQRVIDIQSQLVDVKSEQERKTLKEQLSYIIEKYWAIEKMPTWPVDITIRRRFKINTLALFLPLISQLLRSDIWKKLIKAIEGILKGL